MFIAPIMLMIMLMFFFLNCSLRCCWLYKFRLSWIDPWSLMSGCEMVCWGGSPSTISLYQLRSWYNLNNLTASTLMPVNYQFNWYPYFFTFHTFHTFHTCILPVLYLYIALRLRWAQYEAWEFLSGQLLVPISLLIVLSKN